MHCQWRKEGDYLQCWCCLLLCPYEVPSVPWNRNTHVLQQCTDKFCEPCRSGTVEGASHIHAEGGPDEVDAKQPALPTQRTLGQWLRTCASATDLEVASVLSMAPSMVSTTEGPRAAPGMHHAQPCRCCSLPAVHSLELSPLRGISRGLEQISAFSSRLLWDLHMLPSSVRMMVCTSRAESQCSAERTKEPQAQDVGVTTVVVPPVKIRVASNTAAKSTGDAEPAQWTPRSCKALPTSEGMSALHLLMDEHKFPNCGTAPQQAMRLHL